MGAAEIARQSLADARIDHVAAGAYRIPTDAPESDGTLEWNSTTLVTVHVEAAGVRGFGYTYASRAAAVVVDDTLTPAIAGRDALDTGARWRDMLRAVRNIGRPGVGSMAIAAVDIALWDLKAKVLGVPLARLLGACRDAIAVYGSGGFTSYLRERLAEQLGGWAAEGMRYVKMKVGRTPQDDPARVRAARRAIENCELFVDANGAYTRKQALTEAAAFAEQGVTWFEEPVSSDDLEGLRLIRDSAPAGMAIAAGEYGHDGWYFRRMLDAGAVDVLQADATRCGGVTGFMEAAAICAAYGVPLSSHCAPSLHLPLMCAARTGVHLEYFHDHVRIEGMLFDGFVPARSGLMSPDRSRPGLGVELKTRDAERYRC
ncbi:MAG TPA: enolase C-terminal domain-like protein [Burkholderiales bacterium]|nr:enolase C-terminal domain-like protein [Burkholderiales bacterium]